MIRQPFKLKKRQVILYLILLVLSLIAMATLYRFSKQHPGKKQIQSTEDSEYIVVDDNFVEFSADL